MKRDVKFRFWDEELKTYKYDYYLIDTMGDLHDEYGGPDCSEVIIEQYTGLKDKNGKEIYEGDIIKFTDLEIAMKPTGVVCFANGKFFVKDWDFADGSYHIVDFYDYNVPRRDFEVVGNIHENPGLLEESK